MASGNSHLSKYSASLADLPREFGEEHAASVLLSREHIRIAMIVRTRELILSGVNIGESDICEADKSG
ncbi:MAG: hypothetical protein M1132_08700 [Chloroflexi bacterium]|nr:hypothetical protein [Chloroflexota bacterium]